MYPIKIIGIRKINIGEAFLKRDFFYYISMLNSRSGGSFNPLPPLILLGTLIT